MKLKYIAERAFGGVSGAAIGLVAPHISCLGAVTAGAIGAGADAGTAQTLATSAGAVTLAAAAGIAAYGMKPCSMPGCLMWGEVPKVRAKKAIALALAGFVAAGVYNTVKDRGIGNNDRTASYLQWARDNGQPIWKALNDICYGGPK